MVEEVYEPTYEEQAWADAQFDQNRKRDRLVDAIYTMANENGYDLQYWRECLRLADDVSDYLRGRAE